MGFDPKEPVDNLDDEIKEEEEGLDLEEEEDKGDDEGDEDLDKPITKKDLLDFRKGIKQEIDSRFIKRRHDQKPTTKPYKPELNKDGKDAYAGRIESIELQNAQFTFGQENNLTLKEVKQVFAYAKSIGVKPTSKILSDPFVQGGLEKLRTSSNLRENTPSGSGSSNFEVEGKKWAEMTPDERQKNFGARQKAIISSRRK